jgi:uncharacterized protein (TIGR02246 family)
MKSTHGDADTAAIIEFWNQYAATWDAGDIDAWMALWTEDGVQLPPGAPANVGKEQIRKSNGLVLDQWTFDTAVHVEEVGGSGEWAYCWGRYTQTSTAKAGGDPEYLDAKFMSILRKQPDGSWKLHRDAFNSNVP